MQGRIILIAAALSAITAHAADLSFSVFTNPKTYLREFPLGTPQAELYAQIGAPMRTLDLGGGRVAWVYERGEGLGLRTFTFEIADGAVREVRYNQQGISSWNNLTATKAQGASP